MSEDRAERRFFKVSSFDDADSIMDKLTDFPYSECYMEPGSYPTDRDDTPEWMREPVWIIEITVRRA